MVHHFEGLLQLFPTCVRKVEHRSVHPLNKQGDIVPYIAIGTSMYTGIIHLIVNSKHTLKANGTVTFAARTVYIILPF